ncbi:MAG: hypothetical protein CML17_11365, partial [Pusillimonas sp.]|nr:hypothetical protein [Pusillimonas sp.]
MADVTVLETLSLLTKVSADTSDLIKQLSSRIDNIQGIDTSGKEKEELVKKAEPVIVTDFGKAAEKDLAKIGGDAEKERQKTETEKDKNNNLLKLLGLAGASALALKFLFDGEGYTGLVQGFQKAFQNTTNFANKSKGLIDDIGKRLGTFADDIGSRIGVIVDKIMTKTNTWAKSAKVGIKNAMDDIGKRLGTFGDDIARGLTAVVNNAKNIASRVAQTSTGLGDDIARGGVRAAATQPGIFSRVVSGAKSIGGATLEGAKNLGSKTIQGAKYVGGKVIDTGKVVGGAVVEQGRRAVNFTKEQVLKPVGNLISKVKPLKILKSIAKSPFLAPAFEAFFTGKDIKNLKDRYATGEIDMETLNFLVGKRLIKSVTGLIGGLSGATLAAPLGSFIPI